ncbi:MAG: CBS domain-containing protein [Candidatus Dadabacteria bacterium]|nr:CBS domain-containing protein [Candidatus Dadabacteria bacterium]NIQ14186.1 CBS domain-containing protein [Candidatus Dadabacteria bacterium]
MKWSTKVGKIRGINVYIHFTFWLIILFVGYSYWKQGNDPSSTIIGILFVMAIFLCVLLHEFGHALTAQKFGIKTRDITLLPIGGLARLEKIPENPVEELWITVAGPLVNVVIAGVLYLILKLTGTFEPLEMITLIEGPFFQRLMIANIAIFIFNLLPAFPMDGGRMLRAILAMNMNYVQATQVAVNVGQIFALLFGILGFFANPFLIIIALFVWIGATMEGNIVQIKHELSGIPVKKAMITDFKTLDISDNLSKAMNLIIAGTQKDFPVLDNKQIVGVLTERNMLRGLSEKGAQAPVTQFMTSNYETIEEFDMLETVFLKLQDSECRTIPVINKSNLVGIFTMENLGEFLSIQNAMGKSFKV